MSKEMNVFQWLPCPVVFICSAHEGRRDIMTATAMFLSEKEPLLTVSVATGHLTDQLIEKAGEFTLGIAAEDQRNLAIQLGSTKGDGNDKFQRFGIQAAATGEGGAPIPEGVAAWMQCRVENTREIKGYRVLTGRVTAGEEFGKPPLIWQRDQFFTLKPV